LISKITKHRPYLIIMNVGLSPQHGLCQLFRPHPTSRNSYWSDK